MASTVTVICRLPHGLNLKTKSGKTILLNGKNKDPRFNTSFLVMGSDFYGTTEVASEVWGEWIAQNPRWQPMQVGAIAVVDKKADAELAARDVAKEKTGLEPMTQRKDGMVA